MMERNISPYGSWKSPVTTDVVVAGSIGLGQIAIDGGDIYWVEQRASEGGRNVIVRRRPGGEISDVNPPPFNARTRVHEYGGGAFLVCDGVVYFANYSDQRLYRQEVKDAGGLPQPLTPALDLRYADGVMDRRRGRLILVREDHTAAGKEAVNTIVSLAVGGDQKSGGEILVGGNDFYAAPRLSPDGKYLSWQTWNHPNMPWDGCELWVGELDAAGRIVSREKIAGGETESIFRPEWSPEGVLHFVSDRTGWWNLYRWRGGKAEALCPMEAEFGGPQWVFGGRTYAFESENRILCAYSKGGSHLGRLDSATGRLDPIAAPYSDIGAVHVGPGFAVFTAGSPTETACMVRLDLATLEFSILRRSSSVAIEEGYVSIPREIEFPTEGGMTAFGFYYPPKNKDFAAPQGEKPPLLVRSHGGPTSATGTTLRAAFQYWTSRGFAVLDVNYGGSTGYGRAYRERLNGQWGVVDVDDCCNGARFLVKQGEVDGARLAIDGGSAGGYTTLCALTFRDVFHAGASLFGIGELEVFTKDTHKMESRYLDHLIGPYPARKDLYFARSPINFLERLSVPLILFQGLDDKIVPPNQAEMMFEAVRKKNLPVAYLAYEGEQHGFRKAENIKRTLEAEFYFFAKVFRFQMADAVEPVNIENLK